MNILLVNDDGIGAKGIEILKNKLAKYGKVIVFAPTYHQSGKSVSFSLAKGFDIKKYNEFEYSADGTPADVTLLALHYFDNIKFDLVISGCNDGPNISYDSIYSGTIGAGLEANNHGYPSIAFSTDFDHFDIVEKEFDDVFKYILENKLYSNKYCLNVNFPLKKFEKSKGIRITREIKKKDQYYIFKDNGLVFTDRYEHLHDNSSDTDVYAITHGYISICPLKPSFFSYKDYYKLKKAVK